MRATTTRAPLAAGVLLAARLVLAAEPFQPAITDVAVFKDGHSLVLCKAKAEVQEGWCRTEAAPAPVLGTFWAFSTQPGLKVDYASAGMREVQERSPCLTLDDVIQANVGKSATVVEQPKGAEPVAHQGVLRGILSHETEVETDVAGPNRPRYNVWGHHAGYSQVHRTRVQRKRSLAAFVMVQTNAGMSMIKRDLIRSVTIEGQQPATELVKPKQVREIALHVAGPAGPFTGKAKVGMVYLQRGLRWIPNYRIDLLPEGKARVTLRATIINELADLKGATARLVVGVPSFAMQGELSPMALRDRNIDLGRYFQPPGQQGGTGPGQAQYLSNAFMSQMARPARGFVSAAPGPALPAEGQQEDLYLYHVPNLDLKKGDRATLQLLQVTVPYEDIYTWTIPALPPREMWRHIQQQQRTALQAMTVPRAMHEVRLTNQGASPWTTAPATVFREDTPLGQHVLAYTSPKNTVDLPVTVATDLNTRKRDKELDRSPDKKVGGYSCVEVSLHGTLTVANFKDRAVRIYVKRQLIGFASAAANGGKVTQANSMEEAARET